MYALPAIAVIDHATAVSLLKSQALVAKLDCIYDSKAVFKTTCYYHDRPVYYKFYIPLSDPLFHHDRGVYQIVSGKFMQYIEFMRYSFVDKFL